MPQLCPQNFEYPRQLKELPDVYLLTPNKCAFVSEDHSKGTSDSPAGTSDQNILGIKHHKFQLKSKIVLISSGEAEALIMRVSPKSGYWRGSYELVVEIDFSVIAARWHESLHQLRGHLHNDYNRYPMAI